MLSVGRRALDIVFLSLARRPPSTRLGRSTFALTANSQDTASLHPSDVPSPERVTIAQAEQPRTAVDDYASAIQQQKYDDLFRALNNEDTNPNWIWTRYVDFLDFARREPLPLEVHQQVLRKCTQEVREARVELVRRLYDRRNTLDNPHLHEGRFLTVIHNIRKAGYTPSLDDYEFILKHFAGVGHYIGAAQVLQEVIKTGLEPHTKTFGLCLRAIAYRLSLPCRASEQLKLREQCSQLCLHLASLIRKRKQRVPSACLDLILRIMKDADNADVFKSLLKVAYGIDLDYLDRHPVLVDSGFGDPEPFSTAALTTLVDFLGRQKDVSKMIAAFEVLSTPLNVSSSEIHMRNFDDDDDDYPITTDSSKPPPLPYARPNATTYNTMIRHFAHLHETALVKHYAIQALELDYSTSARLQADIQKLPLAKIRSPEFRVNVDTFRPILGLANRDKDLGLMKWLWPHFRLAWRRKKQDLEYYASILNQPDADIPQPVYPRYPGGLLSEYGLAERIFPESSQTQHASSEIRQHTDIEPSVTFFTPSSSPSPLPPTLEASDEQPSQESLDTSLEPVRSGAEQPHEPFDLAVHVQVLQRDVKAMKELDSRIGSSLVRLNIRRKEALGRRIWAGKDVYLRDAGKRVSVSREDWMKMVNFGGARPRRSPRESAGPQTKQTDTVAHS